MLNLLSRYGIGIMLIIGAISFFITPNNGMEFPIVLFPIGMIISGLGAFLHAPLDPEPTSLKKIPKSEILGIVLILIGTVCMLLSAVMKALL